MAELVVNGAITPIKKAVQIDYYNTFVIGEDLSYYVISWKPDPNIISLTEVQVIAERLYGGKSSTTYWMQDRDYFPWYLLENYKSVELGESTIDFYCTKIDRGLREFLVAVAEDKVVGYNLRRPCPEGHESVWEQKVITNLKDLRSR